MIICKQCKVKKDDSLFYNHPLTKSGKMGRCIDCVKQGRKTEHELLMARVRDRDRYQNNPKRKLYTVRRGMNSRCYNPADPRYITYNTKGIIVERDSFNSFYNDMVGSYIDHKQSHISNHKRTDTTIDRIDNNGNYSKDNCRRATYKEQANNK